MKKIVIVLGLTVAALCTACSGVTIKPVPEITTRGGGH